MIDTRTLNHTVSSEVVNSFRHVNFTRHNTMCSDSALVRVWILSHGIWCALSYFIRSAHIERVSQPKNKNVNSYFFIFDAMISQRCSKASWVDPFWFGFVFFLSIAIVETKYLSISFWSTSPLFNVLITGCLDSRVLAKTLRNVRTSIRLIEDMPTE